MAATLETRGLAKRFGSTVAVDELTMNIQPGRVTGFVGPNGAGKTTTMHLLLGLSSPTAGEALVAGKSYASLKRPLSVVGAILDPSAVHPNRSARNHLRWLAQSNKIPVGRVDEVLRTVGLGDVARKRAGAFSLGMKQRLGIAAALLGDPPILVLDEPSNGLDPEGIVWMRETLRTLAAEGRTVFVSSHLMSELEGIADQLIVIGKGRLLADTSVAGLIATASGDRVEIRTGDVPAAMTALSHAGATTTSVGGGRVIVQGLATSRVSAALAAAGVSLEELSSDRATLEDAYFRLTRESGAYSAASIGAEAHDS
jgi:ABC-2 type transport system ATP-binding protein